MADIFREVDEDLRRESVQKLWQKYGGYLVAVAVAVVLATAAFVGWREWREAQRREHGVELTAAQDLVRAGRPDEALDRFRELSGEAGQGYRILARLNEAAILADRGDRDAAAAVYDALASDRDVRAPYRDLALVLLAMNTLDTADPGRMIDRLRPVTAAGNPFRFTALELSALLHRRAGDAEAAQAILQELRDSPEAPPSLRERAEEMLRAFGGNTAEKATG